MDTTRKPSWLRAKLPSGPGYLATRKLVDENKLHTVCQSAQCPNLGECWSRGTATVMILGNICTRSCNFCAIQTGRPTEFDLGEPARVAEAVSLTLAKMTKVTGDAQPFMDPGLVKVLDEAEKLAKKAGDSFVPVERILMALAMVPE